MRPLPRLGVIARRGFGRVMPDPFVLAVVLSAVVLAAGVAFGGSGDGLAGRIRSVFGAWSSGVWGFATFAMQVTVMLVLGSALAETPAFRRALDAAAHSARSPRALVGVVAFVSAALGLLNWSLALVGGALLARESGRVAADRGWGLHYPLLCAAGYSGLMVWHGGLSGTAPLKVTTVRDQTEVLGAELAAAIGPLGLDQTLAAPLNLVTSGGLVVLGTLFFTGLVPARDPSPRPIPEAVRAPAAPSDEGSAARGDAPLSGARWVTLALLVPLAAATALRLAGGGLTRLDLDTVNLLLWTLALGLHGRPDRFIAACGRGVASCAGVVIQFPIYAGMMGVMNGVGLTAMLSQAVAAVGAGAVAQVTFLSAGLVNLFVPSGGGQWGVQGPVVMRAALDTGVPPGRLLLAVAYGDQWTNMLQPFWALPLLAITGVQARDIIGYTALWMVVGGAWMLLTLTLW